MCKWGDSGQTILTVAAPMDTLPFKYDDREIACLCKPTRLRSGLRLVRSNRSRDR